MKRKFTVTVLIAVLALAAVFVTACGGKESGVTLVDFPPTATEEAQKLGDVYQRAVPSATRTATSTTSPPR